MRSLLMTAACLLLTLIVLTDAQSRRNVSPQCQIVPSPGRCRQAEERRRWSYSTKIGACTPLYGCYGIRDRNVFISRVGCERRCFVTDSNDPSVNSYLDCEVNPSPGLCQASEKRTYYSYSSKTSSCIQINGCYSLSDKNIFLTHTGCRKNCILNRPTGTALPNIIPGVVDTLPSIIDNVTTLPVEVSYQVATECTVNPSSGVCLPSQKRNFHMFSSKSGSCVQIYGCYSVRDRNVFLSRDSCHSKCIIRDPTGSTSAWRRDSQCYINPSPGRCNANDRQTLWSFSSKTSNCQQIFGCYSVRDRNVFRTLSNCNQKCVGSGEAVTLPSVDLNFKIALECRINPSPGVCTDREKQRFYSYSSKTGDCDEMYGCYSVRDRNVYVTRAGCRRNCFLSEGSTQSGIMESQCYIVPSQGFCRREERRDYFTYSTKTNTCVGIFGCYGIRDRNVFLTRAGCIQACSGDIPVQPITPSVDFGNVEIVPLPDSPDYSIAPECRISPSPGVCRENQKRPYYTFSSKTSSCVRIHGCYNIRDRNVFLRRDRCRRTCYISGPVTPSGVMDSQCYLNPAPGRCPDSEKRSHWSYSSKTMSCTRLYGCYSIRDRNVFSRKANCEMSCTPSVSPQTSTMPPIPIKDVNIECRINPSPGRCRQQDRRTYFSYSAKTHRCTEIYGCFSIRDRNVFLTRNQCNMGCFKNEQPGKDAQCLVNPSPGNCAESQRRTHYSFSSKTSTCVQIYGCYSVRDRNVFVTRAGCRRHCVNVGGMPVVDPPVIDSNAQSKTENNFVDVRNNGATNIIDIRRDEGTNMIDVRNSGRTNMVDVRKSGTTNMVDVRDGGRTNMVDVRNGGRANMVDVRNGGITNMVEMRKNGATNMVDVRNGGKTNMIDVRNGGRTNMVDVRNGGSTNMVDVRNGGRTNMADVRNGERTNMVDVRNGVSTNMVDVRNGVSTKMVDVRNGERTNVVDVRNGGRANMVDVSNGVSTNMVDVRNSVSPKMVDVRNGGRTDMVDVRNGGRTNMVDVRNGRRTNIVDGRNGVITKMVDVRNGERRNMVDVRNGGRTNMVDVRNGERTNMVDVRTGERTNMVNVRNGGRTNMVDVRNGGSTNMVDARNGGRTNMVDVRNGERTNIVDVRNGVSTNMVDVRNDRRTNMVDVRNGVSTKMVDVRNGERTNMVDVRNGGRTNMVDVRNGGSPNMVDVRNGGRTNMVDVRNGERTNMVDVRNGVSTKMVDVRNGERTNTVDVRNGGRTNMVDVRNGGSPNMVDIRNGGRTNMVDVRNGERTNMVDVRNGVSTKMVDVRNGERANMVEMRNGGRTNMVDVRNGRRTNMVDVRNGVSTNMLDVRNGERTNMVDNSNGGSTNMIDMGNGGRTNMVDVRNDRRSNMADIRNGGGTNMVDVRSGGSANMVDVRNTGSRSNMVDIKKGGGLSIADIINGKTQGMVDIRNSRRTNMVDVRNRGANTVDIKNSGANLVDIRQGSDGMRMTDIRRNVGGSNMDVIQRSGSSTTNMVDVRNPGTKMVDVRNPGRATPNMVDVRTATKSTKMADIRGRQTDSGLLDIRSGDTGLGMSDIRQTGSGLVDILGSKTGTGMVDVRNDQTGVKMVDVRGGQAGTSMADSRGGQIGNDMVDIRGGQAGLSMVDIRNGQAGSTMVNIRGQQIGTGKVDIRGGQTDNGLVDIRQGQPGYSMLDIRDGQPGSSMIEIRDGQPGSSMVDIRGSQTGNNMVDIRGSQTGNNMVDIRGSQTGTGMIDVRRGQTDTSMVDIRGSAAGTNMVDIRGGQSGSSMVDIRNKQNTVDIRTGSVSPATDSRSQVDSSDPQSLTDLPIINVEPGIRIARECLINPTPGFCLENQRKRFWTFSTKTNSCTRIMGCFDIHDRNTWLTLEGCRRNCFKNESAVEDNSGILPLECQLNPTPGRCLPSDERTIWVYNTKLGACTQITGCYDFHDRNVWSSQARCRTKCRVSVSIVAPEIPYDVEGLRIHPECHINPSPGRCLENQQRTFWTFSGKTSACTRITGCYNIRDRNTWRSRAECRDSCYVNASDISFAKPLECKLVPSPGRCLDSQKKSVYTFSNKLGMCVEITGCYDFHDRNVWRTIEACNERCHVNASIIPDLSMYDLAQECQLNPTPGRCLESQKRSFYTFGTKAGGCVEIYGCYTINDRNVWYTRSGCRSACLIPKPGTGPLPNVSKTCLRPPVQRPCLPNQQQEWYSYNVNTGACEKMQGCYRYDDQNVYNSRRRCETDCFNKQPEYTIGGITRECRLNPTPGVCHENERRRYWSYSQKTGTCVELIGCYTIRDRNVWLTREMCRNNCLKREIEPRSDVIPNFLAGGTNGANGVDINGIRRGRRGRIITRNMNRNAPRLNVVREITGDSQPRESAVTGRGNVMNVVSNRARDVAATGNGNTLPAVSNQVNTVVGNGNTLASNQARDVKVIRDGQGREVVVSDIVVTKVDTFDISVQNPGAMQTAQNMPTYPLVESQGSVTGQMPSSKVVANLFMLNAVE